VRNHADAIVACDFLVAVTTRFQILYVFLILELGSRRILHFNVTAHPTAEWTLQQFRDGLSEDRRYRFVIHDRDSIFSAGLDQELRQGFGLRILITPPQSPKAKDYASHCTSSIHCDATLVRARWDSLMPCAFRGGFSPGSSYRQSFLSL